MTEGATLLPGVDRAALAAAFGDKLRRAGVGVPTTGLADLSEALGIQPPSAVDELYWLMRVTLVRRHTDLEAFDRVFRAAFLDSDLGGDPHARRRGVGSEEMQQQGSSVSVPGHRGPGDAEEGGLPWHTLPRSTPEESAEEDERFFLPELLPSQLSGMGDTPFDEFDVDQLALLGRWLERAAPRWPVRRSRRTRAGLRGQSIALRPTIAAAGRAGF